MTLPVLPAKLAELLNTEVLAALDASSRPGTLPAAEIADQLAPTLAASGLSPERQTLVRALVLLWHDHLDAAHTLAQSVETADGSFVHAIMHRREPDAWNSKYWWRRVGAHPAFSDLASLAGPWLEENGQMELRASLLPDGRWDAFAFVDACEAARQARAEKRTASALQRLQWLETLALLAWLLRQR